jgi:hypothetical protein
MLSTPGMTTARYVADVGVVVGSVSVFFWHAGPAARERARNMIERLRLFVMSMLVDAGQFWL